MPKPLFDSYLRVSTAKQGRSGLGLEAQKEAVNAHICRESGDLLVVETTRKERLNARSLPRRLSIAA